jgi:hypothetical protein
MANQLLATRNDRITLTPKQANIYCWGWQKSARFRVAVCGRRFGKTYLMMEEIRRAVRLAIERGIDTDNEIWYGAPTFKQAKRNFWRRLKRAIPEEWVAGNPNNTECVLTLISGHVIRIVGLDNFDDLRGAGLWFFVGDEWADCKHEAWTEVVLPMLATSGGHAIFIGTPKGFNHFYDFYVAGQDGSRGEPDHKSWFYTTLQGGNVPPEEVERAKRRLDPRTFRQEYEASFETFAGQVYYAFSRAHSVIDCEYDPSRHVHIGMDFNINPMTATVWQERSANDGEIHSFQVDEIIIPTSNTDEMVREIRLRYGSPDGNLDHITVYPDASGVSRRTSAGTRTDLSILREAGLRVRVGGQNPPVRDRINSVNARFESADGMRRAFIGSHCKHSITCLEKQAYKLGTSEPDKADGFDHANDATGYYMFSRFGVPVIRSTRVDLIGR